MSHVSLIKKLEEFLVKEDRKIMNWVKQEDYEVLNFEEKNYFDHVQNYLNIEIEIFRLPQSKSFGCSRWTGHLIHF